MYFLRLRVARPLAAFFGHCPIFGSRFHEDASPFIGTRDSLSQACLPNARLSKEFINSLVRDRTALGLHAAAVDLPVSSKPSPLICTVRVLCFVETRGRVEDPIALLFVFGAGFAVGYGVREWKSRKRRLRYTYLRETADEAPRVTS